MQSKLSSICRSPITINEKFFGTTAPSFIGSTQLISILLLEEVSIIIAVVLGA